MRGIIAFLIRADRKRLIAACFTLAAFLFSTQPLHAAGFVSIGGQDIPLMEGAVALRQESRQAVNLSVRAYAVGWSCEEAFAFYQDFFSSNGFEVVGGSEAGGYNISVKKSGSLFTLRIYAEQNKTLIQFIW